MYLKKIKTYIPIKIDPDQSNERLTATDFEYDDINDCFICPNGKQLTYKSYRLGKGTLKFSTSREACRNCSLKSNCTNQPFKTIEKAYNFRYTIKQNVNTGTYRYDELMRLRKIWCEGNFSHQKANHNLTRTFKRGIENASAQCLLSACELNLKRLVKYIKAKNNNLKQHYILTFVQIYIEKLQAMKILSLQF